MFRRCLAAFMLITASLHSQADESGHLTPPSVLKAPPAVYPSSSVEAREEGTAIVLALVDITGHVGEAEIAESSGYKALDEAAVQSVSQGLYRAASRDGKPEASWIRMPITFQLAVMPEDPPERFPDVGTIVGWLGVGVLIVGLVWSWVLGKRASILWLSGLVALWALVYPVFVATHWSAAKRNLLVILLGMALIGLYVHLLPQPGAMTGAAGSSFSPGH